MQDQGLKLLRLIVISMGLVLIGGFIFLMSVIYNKTKLNKQCDILPEELNIEGTIESISKSKHEVTLLVNNKNTQQIIIIDLCSKEQNIIKIGSGGGT